jgi:hypothetical protein
VHLLVHDVEHADPILPIEQGTTEMTSNEAGAAGNQHVSWHSESFADCANHGMICAILGAGVISRWPLNARGGLLFRHTGLRKKMHITP